MVSHARAGVALLITLMFVLVITVAIGYGLKTLNKTTQSVTGSKMLYQSTAIVEDLLKILNTAPQIAHLRENNSSSAKEELYAFLSSAEIIPLKMQDLDLLISFKSARAKFNPNILAKNRQAVENLKVFVNNYGIESNYVDILQECMRKYKAKNLYNNDESGLLDENPTLFTGYIASKKQLNIINSFYKKEYNDEALKKIDFDELFYYSQDVNMVVDLNYATAEVWQLLLQTSADRARELSANGGEYDSIESLGLSYDEKKMLKRFKTSFYEPYLYVTVKINGLKNHAKIAFEYDIKKKKGSNFVFQI